MLGVRHRGHIIESLVAEAEVSSYREVWVSRRCTIKMNVTMSSIPYLRTPYYTIFHDANIVP